ncbi:hypothetical protein BDN70DRAFT_902281, partial [Pholiota conissans]
HHSDSGPDPEFLPPDKELLDEEAFKAAELSYNDQVKILKFRKDISRRLAYQHAKDQNPTKHVFVGCEDPLVVLMTKIAGIPLKKPRMRTAHNVWSQENRQLVDAIFDERIRIEDVPLTKRAGVRMQVYKECFDKLDLEVKRTYEKKAAEEHRLAIEKIELELNSPPSQDPADRQQVLKGLPTFVQPILDLISDYTGWKATLLVGGPEPADQGRLNMMSFHAGETVGNIKMNFGRSERRGYKNFVMPIFGSFLKKCYTVEDCRATALSDVNAMSLAEVLQLDGGNFSVESVESAVSYIKVACTSSENRDLTETSQTPPPTPATFSRTNGQTTDPRKARTSSMLRAVTPTLEKSEATGGSPVPSPIPSPCASPMLPSQATSVLLESTPTHAMPPSTASPAASPLAPTPPPQSSSRAEKMRNDSQKRPLDGGESGAEGTEGIDIPLRKRLRSSKVDTTLAQASSEVRVVKSQASTRSTSTSPSLVAIPPLTKTELAASPDWFLKVYQMFLSKDLGVSWVELVRSWAHFEKDSDYEEQEKLGAAGRPPCVKAWISRARSTTYRPDLGALPAFEKGFRVWWASLQPEWRCEGSTEILKQQQGDLDNLRRPGKNGLVSVLAALFFWAAHAEKNECAGWQQRWEASADDVRWVIQSLNSSQ